MLWNESMKQRIEVHYFLNESRLEFSCPYCKTAQGWPGSVHLIHGAPHPAPTGVVQHHLIDCPAISKGSTDKDLDEEFLDIVAVIHR